MNLSESTSTSRSDFDFVLRVLRRRRGLIVLCALLATCATLGFSLLAQKQYTATATLLFRPSQPNQALDSNGSPPVASLSDRDAATNLRLVDLYGLSQATASVLATSYKHLTPGTVRQDVTVSSESTSNLVDVTATAPNPELSAAIANTYARQFIAAREQADRGTYARAERVVQAQLANAASLSPFERQTLLTQAQQLRLLSVMQTGNAELTQPALTPGNPSSPRIARNTAIGLVLGLILGFALALLLERLDRRITDVSDLEAALDLPVLGVVPESSAFDQLSSDGLPPLEGEAFRILRARLRYFNVDRDISSLVVASAAPDDGKSTIAYHLARTAASTASDRVILVEADLRQPRLAARTDLEPIPGLAELITQALALEDVVQKLPTGIEFSADEERTFDVLVAGARPPNPLELMESHKMGELLERLKNEYDLVVIDTPPIAVVADAIPLMAQVDGVLIVARLNSSTKAGVARLREQLTSLGAPLLGTVGNRFVAGRTRDEYGFNYGYRYYSAYESVTAEPSGREGRSRNGGRAAPTRPSSEDSDSETTSAPR